MIKLNKREKNLFWNVLHFHIYRYLRSVEFESDCGSERADHHWYISEFISWYLKGKGGEYFFRGIKEHEIEIIRVHTWLADNLTDRLDEKIGFPIYKPMTNSSEFIKRFFDYIMNHINDIYEYAILDKKD